MSFNCLAPRLAYQEFEGQKPIFLRMTKDYDYEWFLKNLPKNLKLLLLPCGKCANCQKKKAEEWTSRLLKETENFEFCYFITLTYNDENLKDINKRDLQLFLKRYRKIFNLDLKYYITGEYGEASGRSHYHAIFFQNKPLNDLRFYKDNLYISKEFEKCWSLGNCLISKQVNDRSIKYTIAYTLKKIGESKIVCMSKGLGLAFLRDHKEAIKKHDGFYVRNGFKQSLPFYFKRKLKQSSDPEDLKYLQDKENEVKPSVCVSGHTLGDLAREFIFSLQDRTVKGKGEF